MTLKITFYDGIRNIGGNKFLVEDKDTYLFLDFGTPFSKRYQYFEEYLNPRSIKGLLDPLAMGLLPPIKNIYREDFICSNEVWKRVKRKDLLRSIDQLDGVILSHAHIDHSGYISFLRPELPVFCSQMTSVISKAIQDSTQASFEWEVAYKTPRELESDILKSKDYRTHPYNPHRFVFVDQESTNDSIMEFFATSSTTRPLASLPPTYANKIGNLGLRYFPVDHSIFGAGSYALETSIGWLIYTGDLRLHGKRGYLTERFIEEARSLKPKVLILEGTRTDLEPCIEEDEVFNNAAAILKDYDGLVIADFGPRNIERLITFLEIANLTHRSLVVNTKDAYLLAAMRLIDHEVPQKDKFYVYKEAKGAIPIWEQRVLSKFGDRLITARDVHSNENDFILCFSFWEINELIDINPEKGIYIYSASEAWNEEQRLDLERLRNWLSYFGMNFRGDPENPQEKNLFHASGHASGKELLEIIKEIKPEILIPVHTENPEFFAQNLKGEEIKIRLPEEGETILL
ncbi:MAG: MBL fold metallo-hydrolase RNA specificity domain-containing protein [bacterium]|nr:MBL fold metallo-hydrolase RNA specificity domain-containing protein [bacterium]